MRKPVKRKIRILNRRFQLGTVFSVLTVSVLSFLAVIFVLTWIISAGTDDLAAEAEHVMAAVESQQKTFDSIIASSQASSEKRAEWKQIQDKNAGTIVAHVTLLQRYASRSNFLLIVILTFSVAIATVIFFYLIRLTHRIYGPIHVMAGHLKEITNGKIPDMRDLRDDDCFREFYSQFVRYVQKNELRRMVKPDTQPKKKSRSRIERVER